MNVIMVYHRYIEFRYSNRAGKYTYTGQSTHALAYAYYTNNYGRQVVSKCSPQVYDILTSKANMNPPLISFHTDRADVAFDVSTQYTQILVKCDEFGWPIHMQLMTSKNTVTR